MSFNTSSCHMVCHHILDIYINVDSVALFFYFSCIRVFKFFHFCNELYDFHSLYSFFFFPCGCILSVRG